VRSSLPPRRARRPGRCVVEEWLAFHRSSIRTHNETKKESRSTTGHHLREKVRYQHKVPAPSSLLGITHQPSQHLRPLLIGEAVPAVLHHPLLGPLWHFGRLFRPTSSLSWCAGQRPAFLPSEHGYGLPHRLHWYFATYAIVDSRLQERFLGLIVSLLLRSHAAPIRTAAVPPRNPCGRDDRVQIP
jgi:hypothetical protein